MRGFSQSQGQYFHVAGQFEVDSLASLWQAFGDAFWQLSRQNVLQLHAFVLMSEHYHALVKSLPDEFSMENTLQRVSEEFKPNSILWQERVEREISSFKDYQSVYRYIYRNPVEAGLCESAENYQWSTLPMVLGQTRRTFPVVDAMEVIQCPQRLAWISA